MAKKVVYKDRAFGWAWEVQNDRGIWELCFWMVPTCSDLICEAKPSSEARPVRVFMERVKREAK